MRPIRGALAFAPFFAASALASGALLGAPPATGIGKLGLFAFAVFVALGAAAAALTMSTAAEPWWRWLRAASPRAARWLHGVVAQGGGHADVWACAACVAGSVAGAGATLPLWAETGWFPAVVPLAILGMAAVAATCAILAALGLLVSPKEEWTPIARAGRAETWSRILHVGTGIFPKHLHRGVDALRALALDKRRNAHCHARALRLGGADAVAFVELAAADGVGDGLTGEGRKAAERLGESLATRAAALRAWSDGKDRAERTAARERERARTAARERERATAEGVARSLAPQAFAVPAAEAPTPPGGEGLADAIERLRRAASGAPADGDAKAVRPAPGNATDLATAGAAPSGGAPL